MNSFDPATMFPAGQPSPCFLEGWSVSQKYCSIMESPGTHFGEAEGDGVEVGHNVMNRDSQRDGSIEDPRAIEMQLEIVAAGDPAHLWTQVCQDYPLTPSLNLTSSMKSSGSTAPEH